MGLFDHAKSILNNPETQCALAAGIFPPAGLAVCANNLIEKAQAAQDSVRNKSPNILLRMIREGIKEASIQECGIIRNGKDRYTCFLDVADRYLQLPKILKEEQPIDWTHLPLPKLSIFTLFKERNNSISYQFHSSKNPLSSPSYANPVLGLLKQMAERVVYMIQASASLMQPVISGVVEGEREKFQQQFLEAAVTNLQLGSSKGLEKRMVGDFLKSCEAPKTELERHECERYLPLIISLVLSEVVEDLPLSEQNPKSQILTPKK